MEPVVVKLVDGAIRSDCDAAAGVSGERGCGSGRDVRDVGGVAGCGSPVRLVWYAVPLEELDAHRQASGKRDGGGTGG